MIALTLSAILIRCLFSFYVQSSKLEIELNDMKRAILEKAHLQSRLQNLFSNLSSNSLDPIYTKKTDDEKNNLILITDQGIDPDPLFSGLVCSRIFLDDKENLVLGTWPIENKKNLPWRQEILFKDVESFSFLFLSNKDLKENSKDEIVIPISKKTSWRSQWLRSQLGLPSIIRLQVTKKNEDLPIDFAFFVPSSGPLVTFGDSN